MGVVINFFKNNTIEFDSFAAFLGRGTGNFELIIIRPGRIRIAFIEISLQPYSVYVFSANLRLGCQDSSLFYQDYNGEIVELR